MRRTYLISIPLFLGIALLFRQGYLHFAVSQPVEDIPVYEEVSRETGGIDNRVAGIEMATGQAWADYDNDGWVDLYVTDTSGPNTLYRNNGAGSGYGFTNIRPQRGMEQMSTGRNDWTETTPTWGDAENDGDLDLFVSQIYMYASYTSKLYRNNGTSGGITTFTDMDNYWGNCPADPKQDPAPGSNCAKTWYTFSAAWADYDDDGDLDLAWSGSHYWVACEDSDGDAAGECQYHGMTEPEKPACAIGDPNTWCQPQWLHLWRNDTAPGKHWIEVNLEPTNRLQRMMVRQGARVDQSHPGILDGSEEGLRLGDPCEGRNADPGEETERPFPSGGDFEQAERTIGRSEDRLLGPPFCQFVSICLGMRTPVKAAEDENVRPPEGRRRFPQRSPRKQPAVPEGGSRIEEHEIQVSCQPAMLEAVVQNRRLSPEPLHRRSDSPASMGRAEDRHLG